MRKTSHCTFILDIIYIHHFLATFVDTLAVFANVVLFYLIIFYSNFSIKEFKGVFLLTCVGDTVLSIVVLLGQPVSSNRHAKISWLRISTNCVPF